MPQVQPRPLFHAPQPAMNPTGWSSQGRQVLRQALALVHEPSEYFFQAKTALQQFDDALARADRRAILQAVEDFDSASLHLVRMHPELQSVPLRAAAHQLTDQACRHCTGIPF